MKSARFAAAIAVLASAAALTAACDSPSSAAGGGSSGTDGSAVRYVSCMRSHGVPEYPEASSSGQLPKITPSNESQLGVSQTRFNAAQSACQKLWPYQRLTVAQQRVELADAVKFARCMRSRGVPGFPDPTTDPDSGRVEFVISKSKDGFDINSPQILAKVRICERGLPASILPGSPDGVEVRTTR
ncbi:MAG TPA: hypothetical protein VMA95_06580 [Streptosporangiaceae bacterium]|nr:hypothetical protein [Streptosporangiaceae bacterium]